MQTGQQEHNPVDTQWPRYQVFQQEKEGTPHQDVGSVHAPDPEMALFNARDVFVRRPECISLWVVPVDAITFRTEQELQTQADIESFQSQENLETYQIFSKVKSGGTLTWAGTVEAANSEEALRKGVERFSSERPPFIWCTFPERAITANQADDIESLFTPARDKHFRLPSDFHTHSAMRKLEPARKASHETRLDETATTGSEQSCEC
jgi:ring-1,2-phenylacetyl-CoA epoxidase subunit PaaB